ncbi:MAG: hypothetical protein ACRELC_08505 [Gemmatimonadota bacterium]
MAASRSARGRGWAAGGVIALAAAGLALAHRAVDPAGLSAEGALLVLDHAFTVGAVLLVFAVAWSWGRIVLDRFRLRTLSRLERAVFAIAVGGGVLGTGILVLGALGLLEPWLLWGLLALSAIADHRALRAEWAAIAGGRPLASIRSAGPTALGAVAVLAAVTLFLLVQALAPPSDWDALMYHLRVPAQFVAEGRVFVPEDNLHVTRIGLAHMLYVPLLAIGVESGPALVSAGFALLTALACFAVCERLFDRRTAWTSLALVWGSSTILMVAITPRVDLTVALYTLLAHHALLVALERPPARGGPERGIAPFALAGLLLGLAVGVKLQALLYVAAVGPLALWAGLRAGARARGLLALVACGAAFVVAAAPWLIKNWVLVGAPLYPALAEPRLQPWLARLYGGPRFPAGASPDLTLVIWELRRAFNIVDFFRHPERLAIEGEARYYLGNPLLLLLPLAALARPWRPILALAGPALLYLAGLFALLPEANLRYLLPGILPLTLVAVRTMWGLLDRLPASIRRFALVLASLLALWPAVRTMADLSTRSAALGHAAGLRSGMHYLQTHWNDAVRTYGGLLPALDRALPRESRTLMLFDARGFHLDRRVVQDNKLTNWPLLARAPGVDAGTCPSGIGFTHVLVNVAALDYYRRSGLDPERLAWSTFERMAARCLDVAFQEHGFVLFRDRTAPPADR